MRAPRPTGGTRGAVRGRNPPVTALPCQPPLGKGAEGTGGRIATGALRPRNDGSRKNLRVIPRPVRRLVVGIRNTPAQRTRRTDCHTSDIGHWFAMTHYKKCGVSPDGRTEASAPTEGLQEARRGEGTPPYGGYKRCGAKKESPSHGFAVPGQIVKQVQHFLIEKALLGRASRGIFWGGN